MAVISTRTFAKTRQTSSLAEILYKKTCSRTNKIQQNLFTVTNVR